MRADPCFFVELMRPLTCDPRFFQLSAESFG